MKHTLVSAGLLAGVLAAGSLLSACPSFAQNSSTNPQPSSISGIVIQQPGEQPLKKVTVEVVSEERQQSNNYTGTTDAEGRFHIDNVAPGRYMVFLERTGFAEVSERGTKSEANVFSVRSGESIDNIVLRMSPAAIINGKVVDEDGDPLSGVSVRAMRKKPGTGGRETAGAGTTNDLGEYRISGLFSGQYFVAAIPPPDPRDYEAHPKTPSADTGGDSKPDTRYLTTYYPDTLDSAQASTVAVKPGDEVPVNFMLTPSRTYRLRGIVTGIPSKLKPTVELVSKWGDMLRGSATDVGTDGQFEVRGVGPGTYVLYANLSDESGHSLNAQQDVHVAAADLEGIKLSLQPTFQISGRLWVENARVELTQFIVSLRPRESDDNSSPFGLSEFGMGITNGYTPVDRSGSFSIKDAVPGAYTVQASSGGLPGSYMKSLTVNGQDATTGFIASGPTEIQIVMNVKGGTIEGSVIEKDKDVDTDHPVANATVVAVPDEKFRNIPDRYYTGESDQNGAFVIRGVAPGSYTLFAWRDLEEGTWRDADFMRSQEANGMAVKVDPASDQKIELKLSTFGAEWR
jgi:hypothetical protein